jgi:hypothetical protein
MTESSLRKNERRDESVMVAPREFRHDNASTGRTKILRPHKDVTAFDLTAKSTVLIRFAVARRARTAS